MVLRIIGEMKAKFKVRNPSFSKKITVLLLLVLSFTLSSCNPSTNTGHLSYSKENKTYQYKLDNITENALHIGLFYSEEVTSTSDNTIPNNGHITKLIKYKVYPISDAEFTALSTRICSLTNLPFQCKKAMRWLFPLRMAIPMCLMEINSIATGLIVEPLSRTINFI